jgi:hypothetical protein
MADHDDELIQESAVGEGDVVDEEYVSNCVDPSMNVAA